MTIFYGEKVYICNYIQVTPEVEVRIMGKCYTMTTTRYETPEERFHGDEVIKNEEKSWLSIIEHLKDQISNLKDDKENLEDQLKDLKIRNQELTRNLLMI